MLSLPQRARSCFLLALLALLAGGGAAPAQTRPPNIIFILADDLGWTDLGCQGSKYYETPAIDRLAAQGLRFTQAHTCGPNCQPTRACLMTGRYGPRHGVYTVGSGARGQARYRRLLPADNRTTLAAQEVTVAEVLQKAGYTTGIFGKWHLGQGMEHHPLRQGFDTAIVSMGRHFDFTTSPRVPVPKGAYLADFLTDHALRFLEESRERPFFLYLAHFAVHSPFQAKKELIARFEKKTGADGHDSPAYAAMIASLDESVGRVLDRLEELKLAENTVVIFSSDNGGVGGYAAAGVAGAREVTSNAPLRGGKGMLHEGGHRVPFLVRWPGVIQPGTTCATPITSVDLLPTLAELAGTRPPADRPIDGVSLAPLLRSSGKDQLQRRALYWHFPGYLEGNVAMGTWRVTPAGAILQEDWKLIEHFEDGRVELYHLADDPTESRDLARQEPARTRELLDKLHAWRQAVKAPMPRPNPDFVPPPKKN